MFAAAVGSAEATEAWYWKKWIKLVADVRVALSFTMNLVGYGLSFVPRCHVSRESIRYVVSFFQGTAQQVLPSLTRQAGHCSFENRNA